LNIAPWWEAHPGRLEYELARLDDADVHYRVDERLKAAGILRLELTVGAEGGRHRQLSATFPDTYPYTRPEVSAPAEALLHHQNPFSKALCLLGRSTEAWTTTDTLAWLIRTQLPLALAAGQATAPAGPAAADLDEERQAEPVSDYYPYVQSSMILIDGAWDVPPAVASGGLEIGFSAKPVVPPNEHFDQRLLAAVLTVRDDDGTAIVEADTRLGRLFAEPMAGRWSRLPAPVISDDPKVVWEAAVAADPGMAGRLGRPGRSTQMEIRAVLFPEEVAWRASGTGWLFVVREFGAFSKVSKKQSSRGRTAPREPDRYWFVRAGRAGPDDLAARVPELRSLPGKAAAVYGIGALGSQVIDQLARAGVGSLRVLDCDHVDPGTMARHAAGFESWGVSKLLAACFLTQRRSPYVETFLSHVRIGAPRTDPSVPSDIALIAESLDGVELLIDATAEIGLQDLLAGIARARGIGYLSLWGTNGGWGGMAVLIRPDSEACWVCFLHHLTDGTIPVPPEAPSPFVQPPGCASPTFTGSGFDMDEVSLQAVRMAAGYLSDSVAGGYPSYTQDIARLALRTPDGTVTLPTWTGYQLTRHAACPEH
jgi:hypothetical protein